MNIEDVLDFSYNQNITHSKIFYHVLFNNTKSTVIISQLRKLTDIF